MRVVNNLTKPGGIRRVDLNPDTVQIHLHDGQARVYKLVSDSTVSDIKDLSKEAYRNGYSR